jgi:nitroreductase
VPGLVVDKPDGDLGCFPAGRFLAYLIALGYPADRPLVPLARPDRRPFQDVVHWGRW